MSCNVLNRAFGHPMRAEEHATTPLAGGIMMHGYQCGIVWGPPLAAGAQAFRLFGPGPRAEAAALKAAQRHIAAFRTRFGEVNCMELTECNWKKNKSVLKYFIKGGAVKCIRMAAQFSPIALREFEAALSENPEEIPGGPVSCTALLARKMGASDLEAALAAGWAGGVGLSGEACGALGTAIWFSGLIRLKKGLPKVKFIDPQAQDIVERFLKSSDYEFECAKIVGRTFTDVADHARFVQAGGCARILEALAART